MSTTHLNQTWDLDAIFPGGSESKAFRLHLDHLATDIDSFATAVAKLPEQDTKDVAQAILTMQDIAARVREAGAFVSCLNAQNVKDTEAKRLGGRLNALRAEYVKALTTLDDTLVHLPEDQYAKLLQEPDINQLRFVLAERKRRALDKLPAEKEALAAALSVDGYTAWSELYDTIVGRMTIPFEEGGQVTDLSVGQASNRLKMADRDGRERLFAKWEAAWADEAELFASTLNHLAGFRLNLYEARGWDSVLKEPLDINRMSPATLDAMWGVIADNKAPFVEFLKAKANLLGVDQPTWSDVEAPIGTATKTYTYEEARDFIVRHFRQFNPAMADFANMCFEQRWIEAEDRPGKRPGGFCTSFPVSAQTRIFVTFSGTASNVATLAHELGHAYHQHVMRGMPQLLTNYAMNVAETASTFAEMIVADASVKEARDAAEQLSLLEDKVGRSIAMFMNIHARFLFETRFYEARKQGLLDVRDLNQLMEEAQTEAFGGALSSFHPHFWASKLHFYITGTPFYNFPYTFGYLFSTGIYARAQQEGPSFAEKYVALLRDTASMQVEDLANKHLGVDLTKPDFWQSAVDLAASDARKFVELARA
ncbi:M3 family oligoendopeptidase [Alicyclobacillus fastidiosus]|uniref:M3 family oligoendopeptidase n=1 Tax=Alicyclobacillus fastidiosus TaxID=392011 RepID=A0ABV5AE85_9BACL|nr:M3 family oligoendopeptidase [Alicyclobacillus fastidiosus]WEH08799.1 M3 family oligoendopeptidase [Alicyclobacillus fastidiosus]